MKGLGYGAGYRYPHDYEGAVVEQDYLPDALAGRALLRADRPRPRARDRRAPARLARQTRRARRTRPADRRPTLSSPEQAAVPRTSAAAAMRRTSAPAHARHGASRPVARVARRRQ